MRNKHLERFLEFLIIGVALGVTEDLLAVKLSTGAMIDLETVGIVVMVAVPFAAFSELIVDRADFRFIEKVASKLRKER